MVSSDFERLMKSKPPTPEHKDYVNDLARQNGYILDWEKQIAFAETRCAWREEMQKAREIIRRERKRGCM